jgi:hypothetical protein
MWNETGTDRDLKWDEICFVLFRFLNWYGTFRPFRTKRNGIDNLDSFALGNSLVSYKTFECSWVKIDCLLMYYFCVLCFCVHQWCLLLYGEAVLVWWTTFPIVEIYGVVLRFFCFWWCDWDWCQQFVEKFIKTWLINIFEFILKWALFIFWV